VSAERNLSALAHTIRGSMDGRMVELVLTSGARLRGRIVRVDEDEARKPAAVASNGKQSHLLVVLAAGGVEDPVPLGLIGEVLPAF
jgi:hypothetical protein